MMKRLKLYVLSLLILLFLVCAMPSYAQQGISSSRFTIAGPSKSISLINTGIAWHQISWSVTGTASICTVLLDSSSDGVTWTTGGAITGQTCTTNGSSSVVNISVNYVRINMSALTVTSGSSVTVTWKGWTSNPGGGGGTPGGSNTQFQFNDSGAFGGALGATYTKATRVTTLQDSSGNLITTGGVGQLQAIYNDASGLYAQTGTVQLAEGGNAVFTSTQTPAQTQIGYAGNSSALTLQASGAIFNTALSIAGNLTTNITGGGIQCAQVDNTGLVSGTGSPCGTGSGITGLTTGYFPKAGSSTTIVNSLCDEGITTAGTFTCAEKIAVSSNGVNPGNISLVGNTTVVTPATNTFNLMGPNATTFTAYGLQFSSTGPAAAGVLLVSSPSSAVSQITYGTVPNADLTNSTITIAGTSVSLGGSTSSFPNPGAIGGTTPAAITGTTITANTSLTINGGTAQTGTQGTDTKLLTAGTIAGTSAALCTDANGGATTSSCPSGSGAPGGVTILKKVATYAGASGDYSSSTAAPTQVIFTVTATGQTYTLLSTAPSTGACTIVENSLASRPYQVGIVTGGSTTLDGTAYTAAASTLQLSPGQSAEFCSDGTNYYSQNGRGNPFVTATGVGAVMVPESPYGTLTNGTPSGANTTQVGLFVLHETVLVSKLSMYFLLGVAAATCDWGIYDSSGNLMVHVGSQTCNTSFSTNLETVAATTATVLPPGIYYTAWCGSSASISVGGYGIANQGGNLLTGQAHTIGNGATACSAGVLPASLGAVTNNTGMNVVPTIGLIP